MELQVRMVLANEISSPRFIPSARTASVEMSCKVLSLRREACAAEEPRGERRGDPISLRNEKHPPINDGFIWRNRQSTNSRLTLAIHAALIHRHEGDCTFHS